MSLEGICNICCSNGLSVKFPNTQELGNWKFEGVQYQYVECDNCKVLSCYPKPDLDIIKNFYNSSYNYKSFIQGAFMKKIQSYTRFLELRKYLQGKGKVLDFGCGHGYFVELMGQKGYQSYGFDIGSDEIISKEKSSIVYNYNFENYKEDNFDLITAWHVVEHLPDPTSTLKQLYGKLNRGGKIAIAVPNLESNGFKFCKEKWSWVQEPLAHIQHYNKNNLALLLTNAGFKNISAKTRDTLSSNIFDIIISKVFFNRKPRGSISFSQSKSNSNFMFHLINSIRCCFIVLSIFTAKNKGAELFLTAEK